jgi:hypothetical protein
MGTDRVRLRKLLDLPVHLLTLSGMSRFPLLLVILMLFTAGPEGRAESQEVMRMKLDYNQKRKTTLTPVLGRYKSELETLGKRILKKNDLEGAVFIKKEIDSLNDGSWKDEAHSKEPADLTTLREAFSLKAREAMKPVNAKFVADFDTLAKRMMQKGDLAGSVEAKASADALRPAPGGGQDAMAELRKALLSNTWSWTGKPGDRGVEMTFKTDGTVSHRGMKAKWKITADRDVSLDFDNGDQMVLRFDTAMKSYQAVSREYRGVIWEEGK